jgi:hypothetical protein
LRCYQRQHPFLPPLLGFMGMEGFAGLGFFAMAIS